MSPQLPPEREIQLYDALIATHPAIERKGKSSPYWVSPRSVDTSP